MENITLFAAFTGGFLSFLSPCVLPLLPTFSAVLAGAADPKAASPYKIYVNTFCFLLGFVFVFVAMGATASLLGQWLFDYQPILKKVGAVVIILLGGILAGALRIDRIEREYKPFMYFKTGGPVGAFLLGIAFTIGWTPCTGPILATVLVYAGSSDTAGMGALLLFVYAMGFSVPFFFIATILRTVLFSVRKYYKWLPVLQRITGVLLILSGIALWFDWVEKGIGILYGL